MVVSGQAMAVHSLTIMTSQLLLRSHLLVVQSKEVPQSQLKEKASVKTLLTVEWLDLDISKSLQLPIQTIL
jgi:hypothetical protein